MKTVKIKVKPASESLALIPSHQEELTWLWNLCRRIALHNHCLEWYKLFEEKGVDFSDCIKTPLYFNRRSAWGGAACRYAAGRVRLERDRSKKPVAYKRKVRNGKVETAYKFPLKVAYDIRTPADEYATIPQKAFASIKVGGKLIDKVPKLDAKSALSVQRQAEGLQPLGVHSDYIGGLLADFEVAWAAYLDVKQSQRGQPRYKDLERNSVSTFSNNQKPPKIKGGRFICAGIALEPCDKSWEKRIKGLVLRSYKIIKKASGWYLCIACALPAEAQKATLRSKRNKAAAAAKKGITGKKAQQAALGASPEYQEAKAALEENELQIEVERYLSSPCHKPTDNSCVIAPSISGSVKMENGQAFNGNTSRHRIAIHIKQLQSKLDNMREANDKRLGNSWRRRQRQATNNEKKLAVKISRLHERGANSSNAYNHKLATRLSRTYSKIEWIDKPSGNTIHKPEPRLSKDGTHYEPNGATTIAEVNQAISSACIGDLKAKIKTRMDSGRKTFEIIEKKVETK